MFKLTIIGTIGLISLTSAQITDAKRFLQGNNLRDQEDRDNIVFKSQLGCGACIKGGYIFCIPGAEGSSPATWPSTLKSTCYQNSTTLADAKLSSTWSCSNIYSDPTLAKNFCPFFVTKCGSIQSFDFGDIGENTSINITLNAGETCTYKVKADCGLPSFKPSTTAGFEIDNVDYDDDDLDQANRLRMLQENSVKKEFKNKTQSDERKSKGFKSDSEPRRPRANITINRNQTEKGENKKGPKVGRFNASAAPKGQQKFKGGARLNKDEPLCKKRYQQISVTALGNLTNSSRILQSDIYTMTLEIGSEDFSGSFSLFFSASVLVFSLLALF